VYGSAHIIRAKGTDETAIHAFLYEHGPIPWPTSLQDFPEANPGTLLRMHTVAPLGGNPIYAYLDIVAPDGTPWADTAGLRCAVQTVVRHTSPQAPFGCQIGPVAIRYGVAPEFVERWATSFHDLQDAVQRIWEDSTPLHGD